MNYFFAGSVVFAASLVAGASLLEGVAAAFFSTFFSSFFAGAAGVAVAATAGVAGATGVLAGSVAKADTATRPANRVTIDFMISFLLVNVQKLFAVHIYNAVAKRKVYIIGKLCCQFFVISFTYTTVWTAEVIVEIFPCTFGFFIVDMTTYYANVFHYSFSNTS
jgi:hypothetical protein